MMTMKVLALSAMTLMMNLTPMTMIISILMFSSTMMMIKWIETANPWIPLIFTLTFLGGMMIIFMYIVSISTTKSKKNKNKLPSLFVFVSVMVWNLKYGSSSSMVHMTMSNFFTQYLVLCMLIMMILFITTKIINSPFKALKGAE